MSKNARWYKSLFQVKGENMKDDKLANLLRPPRKPAIEASASKSAIGKNAVHQADLITLPHDDVKGKIYKYALVICDVGGDRQTDAEPLTNKDAPTVLKAMKTIYKRGIIERPELLQVDGGSEFKSVVKDYVEGRGTGLRAGKADHHQGQASVEAKNSIIGEALLTRMAAQELETDEPSTEWVEFLPQLIMHMNKRLKKNTKKWDGFEEPTLGKNQEILEEGTKVRVALEAPREISTGKKLYGKFRKGDLRWEKEPTEVEQIILRPDQPPMYLTKKYPNTPYQKESLQVVTETEQNPPTSMSKRLEVEKLVKRKKESGKVFFWVKWTNAKSSWEPRTSLMKDVPDLVKAFEKDN